MIQESEKHAPFAEVSQYFDERVEHYGGTVAACDWGSRESQQQRFRVLCDVLPLEGKSILDIGCGPGYLLDYLEQQNIPVQYTGYDISKKMIEAARERRPGINVCFADVLEVEPKPVADVVIASGIMYRLGDSPQKWFEYLVSGLWRCSRRALAFNCLSAWGADKEPGEFYQEPCDVLRYCCTLSPWVTLRHDYHPRDFTVYVYRHESRCE